jgi:hypothetical protein
MPLPRDVAAAREAIVDYLLGLPPGTALCTTELEEHLVVRFHTTPEERQRMAGPASLQTELGNLIRWAVGAHCKGMIGSLPGPDGENRYYLKAYVHAARGKAS